MLDLLLAPAIIAGVLAFLLARLHEGRRQAVQQLRAATTIEVELIANTQALRRFNATFGTIADKVRSTGGYQPFIPVDAHSAMMFDPGKDRLFDMDRGAIRSVSRYYKLDAQLNELLTEICGETFKMAPDERRREVMRHTQALLDEGLREGEAAIRAVRRFIRERRRSIILLGYDRAWLRLVRRRLRRLIQHRGWRRPANGWARRRPE